uniref:Putative ovule protein n=1 Tax=Solanum chacoense TaxID=4108 RepID=A0A0V0GRW3_SOLCH
MLRELKKEQKQTFAGCCTSPRSDSYRAPTGSSFVVVVLPLAQAPQRRARAAWRHAHIKRRVLLEFHEGPYAI